MGINDRDYARYGSAQPPRLGSGFSKIKWTVNTWLIAICVAVFMLDQFLPQMMAPIQTIPVIPVSAPTGMELHGIPPGAVVDPVANAYTRPVCEQHIL